MRARCPKNMKHDLFVTIAHVAEEWVVDSDGNFVEKLETLETTHPPDEGNVWICHICGTTAEVTPQ